MEEEQGTGQNRLFVILAIALIGLLVLGLLGVGGVFIIRQNVYEQEVASKATPTILAVLPNATASFTPLPPLSTNTPAPTPTNTPVLSPGSGQEAASSSQESEAQSNPTPTPKPSPTRTPVPGAEAASSATVPETGIGGLEAVLIAIGLTVVLFVARRLRTST